ncbi:MAG TPA: AIR synthase related protein, partial [Pirellulaceae bacterium]
QAAEQLFLDPVVEVARWGLLADARVFPLPDADEHLIHVLLKPGVTDPVAASAHAALRELGIQASHVATYRKYWFRSVAEETLRTLRSRVLANESIERVIEGPLQLEHLDVGSPYDFVLRRIPLGSLEAPELERLSREGQLHLSLAEMRGIQAYFRELQRDPTDVELETIAQTWSEHCSHKTLAGPIDYQDENGSRSFQNMLKETIFAATHAIRNELGDRDWCVSVFQDNAGIVKFNDRYHVTFKVETHNHPSALEPYGGANTGVGGVIRDTLGTGRGAKPIAGTDIFCFAPLDTPTEALPTGVLHPRRILSGVVAGVRDYGNRMGIPTLQGAICFDPRYLG